MIVDTAWNGTGGVSTQEQMRETWTIRVVFERVERALEDERVKDSEIRKMSARSYNALKAVVDERWIAPVSASEALVDIQGTRNLEKRNNLAPSQGSPADVAQALEWIMVDAQGVNVRASMHNVREDGWDPAWLRERASAESVGVMTRRASRKPRPRPSRRRANKTCERYRSCRTSSPRCSKRSIHKLDTSGPRRARTGRSNASTTFARSRALFFSCSGRGVRVKM